MFEKQLNELKVSTDENGSIKITQPFPMHDDQEIYLNPAQVEILIQWLKEAKESLKGE